jgi:hypothetical protein
VTVQAEEDYVKVRPVVSLSLVVVQFARGGVLYLGEPYSWMTGVPRAGPREAEGGHRAGRRGGGGGGGCELVDGGEGPRGGVRVLQLAHDLGRHAWPGRRGEATRAAGGKSACGAPLSRSLPHGSSSSS